MTTFFLGGYTFWLRGLITFPTTKKLLSGILAGNLCSLLKSHNILPFKVTVKYYFLSKLKINDFLIIYPEQFTRALDLMNRSLANGGIVDSAPAPAPPPPVLTRTAPPIVMESIVPQGFREVVEYRCAENGILFVPLINRSQAGRPIFRAGNVLCYFDRQVNN